MIEVDFNNHVGDIVSIDDIHLSVEEKRSFGIRRSINFTYKSVSIQNLECDPRLKIADLSRFILLKCRTLDTDRKHILTNIQINSHRVEFDIYVDTSQIYDLASTPVTDIADFEEILVSYQIAFSSDDITKSQLVSRSFTVKLFPEIAALKFECRQNVESVSHKVSEVNKIGRFRIQRLSSYSYFYLNTYIDIKNTSEGMLDSRCISSGDTQSLEPLLNKSELLIPFFFYCKYINNPHTPIAYRSVIEAKYFQGQVQASFVNKLHVSLKPDLSKSQLDVFIISNEESPFVSEKELPYNIQWLGAEKSGSVKCFGIRLSNPTENGLGFVHVRNFKLEPVESESMILSDLCTNLFTISDSRSDFKLFSESSSDCQFDVSFRHDSIQDIDGGIVKIEFNVNFDYYISDDGTAFKPENIELYLCQTCHDSAVTTLLGSISEDTICSRCASTSKAFLQIEKDKFNQYDYLVSLYLKENKEKLATNSVDGTEMQSFSKKVIITIEANTGNSWLALDFGTSASVAAYGTPDSLARGNDDDLFIDMNKSLRSLYGNRYNDLTFSEKSSNIISSDILLRSSVDSEQRFILDSTSYNDDVIHISPSKEEVRQNSIYRIPFLKSLIGFKELPDLSNNYGGLKYYVKSDDKEATSFRQRKILVNDVLKNVYNSFLRDFVTPRLEKDQCIDKIVVTIPNTFTPKHVSTLRGIIENNFEQFRKDYVEFVSESDAVALDYVTNWNLYNYNREDRNERRNKEEFVLVYDIGAGTTDLTLFKLSEIISGKRSLKIIGKIGKATAGNYLDYTIADIIDNLSTAPNKMTFDYLNNLNALACKNTIKNELKPKLDRDDENVYISASGLISMRQTNINDEELQIGQITNHELMKLYLKENSIKLLEQFYGLFGGQDDKVSSEHKRSRIDTVLFTGRTIQYAKLRRAVQESIELYSDDQYHTHFIYQKNAEKLKSVVVRGALNFAINYRDNSLSSMDIVSNNLMARYGFIYKDINTGLWEFLEILNPASRSISQTPKRINGVTVYEYDTDKHSVLGDGISHYIDMSGSAIGYFVQSFSLDTAQDVNEQNWQYVTVMFSFNKQDIAHGTDIRKVPVRVRINDQNEMIVNVGSFEEDPKAPLRMELTSNETFKKSLWPYA